MWGSGTSATSRAASLNIMPKMLGVPTMCRKPNGPAARRDSAAGYQPVRSPWPPAGAPAGDPAGAAGPALPGDSWLAGGSGLAGGPVVVAVSCAVAGPAAADSPP